MDNEMSLKQLAEGIEDSYEDFVLWLAEYAEERKDLEPIIRDFINSRENVTTSDVIEYVDDILDPK